MRVAVLGGAGFVGVELLRILLAHPGVKDVLATSRSRAGRPIGDVHPPRRATGRTTVVSIEGGWHGRTAATLACTDSGSYEAAARMAGIPLSRRVPFGHIATLQAAVDQEVAALIIEPVQGMAGARASTPEFLSAARTAFDRSGAVLVFDEIQSGVGRCGAFTAGQAPGTTPDILTLAKGLASGLPIGAVVVAPSLSDGIGPGDLGSTFGGGPVPCAAACATLQVIDDEGLIDNALAVGGQIANGARAIGVPTPQAWDCSSGSSSVVPPRPSATRPSAAGS